ncbi:MAG: 4-alpha-glucanotransferase [Lysobacterales bacterium]
MDSTPATILPVGKKAGVGMHFTSLSGPYGIGDIGDRSLAFIDRLVSMKIGYWQFLPTGPTAYGDSPYQPLSAFAGNEMLIGVEPLVRLGLLNPDEAVALTGLPEETVDYGHLIPKKNALLKRAAERFSTLASPALKSAYEAFLVLHESRWLGDYAIYRILKTQHGERSWPEWEKPYRQRDAGALRQVQELRRADIEQVKITQFLYDQQWRKLRQYAHEKGVTLFGDMPIYIALDSSDAWARPEILLIDKNGRPSQVAGVPPDYFSSHGQLWGNPLYDWKHHASNGYQWWIERLQHAASQMDLVRIDHFRGFESFWAVRYGSETAREGEWLPGPGDALFDAIKTALGGLPIVAEDLGVITPEVDALRQRHNLPGMKVLQFEVGNPGFKIEDVGSNCVCYTGTHDNDTTVGWFNGGGDDTRTEKEIIEDRKNTLKVTGGSDKTIHLDLIRLALNTRARLAVVPMQDFLGLGSAARLNTPGTTSNNWRWRVLDAQLSAKFCQAVANLIQETARS